MIGFDGKVVLVTGAAGGIGRATCGMFHGAGATVVFADLDGEGASAAAAACDPSGATAWGIAHDTTRSDDTERVVAEVVARHGRIDVLVTAAGVFPPRPILELDDTAWRHVLAVNLDGVLYASRAAIPHMEAGASMVHIASVAGHRGSAMHAHYATAKGGVLALSRSLASELAPMGIRVNAVSPGIIATTMTDGLMARKGDIILATTPMARMGTAEEVGGVICFLASDLASFVTGETIHVNGGWYMAS
mgnify:CR=1 FL=1